MNKTKMFIYIILNLCACNKTPHEKHFSVEFITFGLYDEFPKEEKIVTSGYKKIDKSESVFSYRFDGDSINSYYALSYKEDSTITLSSTHSKDTFFLDYLGEKTVEVKGRKYGIYKFWLYRGGIDNDSFIFVEKNYGLLINVNSTWGSGIKLSSYSEQQEGIPELLVHEIFSDRYFMFELGIPK